jgi:phospholipase C
MASAPTMRTGFARYFNGSIGSGAAVLGVISSYGVTNGGSIALSITNVTANDADVSVLDAYTGSVSRQHLEKNEMFEVQLSLGQFDAIVTVAEDATFEYELAGHVETGQDSFSDPAMGGLVTLKG